LTKVEPAQPSRGLGLRRCRARSVAHVTARRWRDLRRRKLLQRAGERLGGEAERDVRDRGAARDPDRLALGHRAPLASRNRFGSGRIVWVEHVSSSRAQRPQSCCRLG
jgi:hypothetical protein